MKQLSERSGVAYQAVHALIRGDRDPQLSTIERLCGVLGLELRARRKR